MLNVVDQRFHLPAHARESGRVHKLGHLQLYIIQGSLPDWNLCGHPTGIDWRQLFRGDQGRNQGKKY